MMRVSIFENNSTDLQTYLILWLYGKNDVEEVTLIKNKLQFLKLAERDPPDVAFIRLSSTHPDGLSILKTLHKNAENTEVIFISKNDEYALEAYDAGASGYFVEPINRKRFENWFSKRF